MGCALAAPARMPPPPQLTSPPKNLGETMTTGGQAVPSSAVSVIVSLPAQGPCEVVSHARATP